MVRRRLAVLIGVVLAVGTARAANPVLGGALPGPLPLFPPTNWWNLDISTAPVDPNSASYLPFMGGAGRTLHPDFGPQVDPSPPPNGSTEVYGFPYIVVDNTQALKTVQFDFSDESDAGPYPIPDEAITQDHWIEEGHPGNVDLRNDSDRHMLIVNKDTKKLYELYNVYCDTTVSPCQWLAGSGAIFDMTTNNRRPEGFTSADAAGLAILPGLVRYEEAASGREIRHAFRVTVRASNGYVWPASHEAGSTARALPLGARLRLKASKDLSGYPPMLQRIFRAMQVYGLIVADNGSDMFISGTMDNRWNNGELNPAFAALRASDFDVVSLGWR